MIKAYGMSHVGMVRSNNEDSFATVPELGLFIVADGMGGAKAGEKASRIAVETVVAEMRRVGPEATPETLASAVQLANHNIRWEAEQNPQDAGMGTTVVAALVREPRAHIVNVGDSRGYLRTGGELYCITSDHSWVNEVGRGLGLSEDQLRSHPYRNVLTKAVGAEDRIEVSIEEIELLPGDVLLLCSDGLHGVAGESALFDVLARQEGLRLKCEALIASALEKGAPDNVTAVLVESYEPAAEQPNASETAG
jgi:protein phosphatase